MPQEPAKRSVEFDFGNGLLTFGSEAEMRNWLERERTAFKWLDENQPQMNLGFVANIAPKYRTFFAEIEEFAGRFDTLNDEQRQEQFNNIVNSARERGGIVTTTSRQFATIEAIRGNEDALGGAIGATQAAAAALYSL